jgi:ABC-type multidrug transport system ATPase subunit
MANIKNQISAFLFKNLALSKRRKGSQIGLLIIFQILFVLAAVLARVGIMARRFYLSNFSSDGKDNTDNTDLKQKYNTQGNEWVVQDEDFIRDRINYRDSVTNIRRGTYNRLFLVIGEDEDQNKRVKKLADRLREVLGDRYATEIKDANKGDFKTAESFDNYYTASLKTRGAKMHDSIDSDSIAGVFIVRQSPDNPEVIEVILNCPDRYWSDRFKREAMLYYLIEAQRGKGGPPSNLLFSDKFFNSQSIEGLILFGFFAAICIIIPFILFILLTLTEKEDRILMLMQLNGITINGFLVSQLFYYFVVLLVPFSLAVVCLMLSPDLIVSSAPFFFSILFLLVMMIQVPLTAICFSFVFKKKIVAVSFSIVFVLFVPFIMNGIFNVFKYHILLWIPVYGLMIGASQVGALSGRTFLETLRLKVCWMPLANTVVSTTGLYLIAIYLFNVVEQGYSGTLKKWHYPITDLYYHFFGKAAGAGSKAAGKSKVLESVEHVEMDSDVKAMMDKCDSDLAGVVRDHLLVFSHINKTYPSGNQAIADVTFALENNMIFGFLGPNGAGKTTLMHIIAGLYEATAGRVILNGIDSLLNRMAFHALIGFCPQHDIYWKELTVSEHLQFFFILRGTDPRDVNRKINELMQSVRLTQYANTPAAKLSGGERRRLSLAMALSGDSKVVLLDEPTTGLDPKVRRIVWDIITEFRGNRLMILTTHSMEEAELLSDKLTIMAHGRLKCFGTVAHLKKKFGGQIFVSFENFSGRFQDAVSGIKECCPPDSEASLVHEGLEGLSGRMQFSGDKKQSLMLMRSILEKKSEIGVSTFGIVQSSLDDVFMNIVRAQDADA